MVGATFARSPQATHIVHGDCVQYWFHAPRGICTVVRGEGMRRRATSRLRKLGGRTLGGSRGPRAQLWVCDLGVCTRSCCGPGPWTTGHGAPELPMGVRISSELPTISFRAWELLHGALELASYVWHDEYPAFFTFSGRIILIRLA